MVDSDRFPDLDVMDIALIAALEVNARRTCSEIAAQLGITRQTVATKLRRLLDSRVISIGCHTRAAAWGYSIVVMLGLTVRHAKLNTAAEGLARSHCVSGLILCAGKYDMIAWGGFKGTPHLLHFLTTDIAQVAGIEKTDLFPLLREIKLRRGFLAEIPEPPFIYPSAANIDATDQTLIRELRVNPRETNTAIAKKLGMNPSSVSRRIQSLLNEGLIHIYARVNPAALGYNTGATIGMRVDLSRIDDAAKAMASFAPVSYVGVCTGGFDLFARATFRDQNALYDFIRGELSGVPGLVAAETMLDLGLAKREFEYSM